MTARRGRGALLPFEITGSEAVIVPVAQGDSFRMNELEHELKRLLIEVLNLEDITVEQIDSEAPLFGEGLGLDSIDALELGVAIRRKYDVRMDAAPEIMRKHFASIANLARFVSGTAETA